MKMLQAVVLLVWLSGLASAYSNSSMTDAYRRVVYGDPIDGVMNVLNNKLPDGWIHALYLALFYIMVWASHESVVMPNALLLIALILYGVFLPAVLFQILLIMVVFAITMSLLKVFSPLWHK